MEERNYNTGSANFCKTALASSPCLAERSWPFLKAMFESMIWGEEDYIIEGEALLPELIIELLEKHPGKLNICFLGFTDIDVDQKFQEIMDFSIARKDWLINKPEEYIKDHIQNMVVHSQKIKKSCEENGTKYFETSDNFMQTIEEAIAYLLD